MKLYHSPRSRSVWRRWLLEELGVPYVLVTLDFAAGEHKQPRYLRVHSHGAVPALDDGEVTIFESAAICMHLADKFADKHLAPAAGTAARAPGARGICQTAHRAAGVQTGTRLESALRRLLRC